MFLEVEHINKVRKSIKKVMSRIDVKISLVKDKAHNFLIKGNELDEYLAEKILRAVDFGFDVEDALLLKDEDYVLEFLNIKEHTRRKKLTDVRARVIGTQGKAKRTIEELTGAVIVIHENSVGVIVDCEHLDATVQALTSLIQGSKHGNVFAYLEKQNADIRRLDRDDLGLKECVKKFDGKI
jgi:ribosomal RNA assembly protein